jgi:hypothetical protein
VFIVCEVGGLLRASEYRQAEDTTSPPRFSRLLFEIAPLVNEEAQGAAEEKLGPIVNYHKSPSLNDQNQHAVARVKEQEAGKTP